MNILICGKNTLYFRNLAERLKREKNEIHYISGSKASEKVGNAVFQQFDFEYTNSNIGRIVKSTKPEVAVLLGATDRNFAWRNPIDDAISFVSGMSSLIMAAKGAGARKIVFVSSVSVFENNEGDLTCRTKPEASSPMNDAFLQVEHICRSVADENTEVVILRLPKETGYVDSASEEDFCLTAAKQYVEGQKLAYRPENLHASMYYADTVDAIIKTVNYSGEGEKNIFQMQGVVFSEQEYIDALQKTELSSYPFEPEADTKHAPVIPAYTDLKETDEETLGFGTRFGVDEIAEKMCKACLSYKKKAEKKKERRLQVLPLIESIVAAILVTVLTYFLRQTWVGDNFSLFTLYALLFGAVYGTTHGLLAGVLATVGTLIIQWNDVGLLATLENYVFFLVFLHLILVGVIAGYMRDKYVRKTTTVTEERNYLAQEVADLTRINDSNIYVKNVYEKRLVGYENSLPRLYELTSQLDYMEPENVIFHANIVAQQLLEVEDVAIYLSSNKSNFFRLHAANSERAISCGKSIKYDEDFFLYAPFELKEIYRNTSLEEDKPSFAGAVMDGDRISAIIMVWTRDVHKINQYECDMLAIVCRLIEKSMLRAGLYDEATREESYIPETRIMNEESFLKHFLNYEDGRKQGVFSYTLLRMVSGSSDALTAQRLLRDSDVLGVANETLYILLPFSNEAESEHVVSRFREEGLEVVRVDGNELLTASKALTAEAETA